MANDARYRQTAYAPEAVYETARVYRDNLRDLDRAMSAYDTLVYDYADVAYPHRTQAVAERAALARVLDRRNSRQWLYKMVAFFVRLTGSRPNSYPLALFLISLATRLILLPLTLKQQQVAKRMELLQPLAKELAAKHKENTAAYNREVMALYRSEGIDPASSLVPPLIQLSVFLVIYQAISLYKYHFVYGTFLWIGCLYARVHPGWVAADLSRPDLLLLLCYGIALIAASGIAPAPNPRQPRWVMISSAALSTVFSAGFIWMHHLPSAFVLYWLFSLLTGAAIQVGTRSKRVINGTERGKPSGFEREAF